MCVLPASCWVDILGRKIHQTDPQTGDTEDIDVPLDVGAVVPNAAGGFVAVLQDGFWLVGSGAPRLITGIREAGPTIRFNDGKCDPSGRFWAGTMAYDESRAAGALYRLGTDGQATRVLDAVTISNGLAWSADGNTMFYIDTPTQTIDAFSFDPSTGAIADRRPVIAIPPAAGAPDGMAIDAEGGLWVALWGGAALHRYLDGRLDRVIPMPVSRPTSCAFGGSDFDELFVTSASTGLTSEARTGGAARRRALSCTARHRRHAAGRSSATWKPCDDAARWSSRAGGRSMPPGPNVRW